MFEPDIQAQRDALTSEIRGSKVCVIGVKAPKSAPSATIRKVTSSSRQRIIRDLLNIANMEKLKRLVSEIPLLFTRGLGNVMSASFNI